MLVFLEKLLGINFGAPKWNHHNKKWSNGNAQILIGIWWWYLPQTSAHWP